MEKNEADMKELKLSTAIKLALGESAQDADLVAGLFDKSKLILSDDGKITGLDEQLKSIKESKPFLFKEAKAEMQKNSGFRPLGAPGQQSQAATKTDEGNCVGETSDPHLLNWFRSHGYKVENLPESGILRKIKGNLKRKIQKVRKKMWKKNLLRK